MRFKNSVSVLIDNFSVTYKQLLYKLIIVAVFVAVSIAILTPFFNTVTNSVQFRSLLSAVKELFINIVNGQPALVAEATENIKNSFVDLLELISQNKLKLIWGVIGVFIAYVIEKFFSGLGNYAMASVINDKMAMRLNSPFFVTIIKNIKSASLYNLIYIPLSITYDGVMLCLSYLLIFKLGALIPFIIIPLQLCLFVAFYTIMVSVKMTFTSDWLPALIRGKMKQGQAFKYTFNRKNKDTLGVLGNFVVIALIIFAINVISVICTFGAGLILTIPASYVLLVAFEFVNYYEREELKYSIDKHTIIKPENEHTPSIKEFFKGED